MKKLVALAVGVVIASGSSALFAQCASCGQSGPAFSSPAPSYSAPVTYSAPAPVYQQAAPVYSAPMQSAPVYSAPIESAPMVSYDQSYAAPVSGCSSCGGRAVSFDQSYSAPATTCSGCGGGVCGGEVSYDGGLGYSSSESTLTVGSVINGETVVSVGESTVSEGSSDQGNVVDGSVEPASDGGEIVAPPEESEVTPPMPEGDDDSEIVEGDA